VIYDITEMKAQEEYLRESASAQAQLMEQLVTSQEVERRRIQMDIHDGPLQSLGVSLMALDRAVRRLDRGEQDVARRELQHLRETLADTVGELRAVLADLSQDVLTAHGLVPALRKQLERFSDITGIRARLESDLVGRLPAEYETLIYRLAQESLSNIRKHSSAYNVVFSLTEREGTLHFQVRDDGVGFDIDEVEHELLHSHEGEKLGLRSMRERARGMGGDLRIFSSPGKGTALQLTCSISAD
jgi:signal transduction histidine kinase